MGLFSEITSELDEPEVEFPSFADRLRFDRTIVDSVETFLTDSEAVSFEASNKLLKGKISWPKGTEGFTPEMDRVRSSNNKSSALTSGNADSIFCTTSKLGLFLPDKI
jgi:hypothetical protein